MALVQDTDLIAQTGGWRAPAAVAANWARADSCALPACLNRIRTKTTVHVLVVDDIEDNRVVLARRLSRRGYRVTEADSGSRALDFIAKTSLTSSCSTS